MNLYEELMSLGCSKELSIKISHYANLEEWDYVLLLIRQYKKDLLCCLHETENKINGIDDIMYEIIKKKG